MPHYAGVHLHLHIPPELAANAEAIMAKVSDLTTAVQGLVAAINDAAAVLQAPAAAPVDDPAIQPLIDQIGQATSSLTTAVQAFKAAHPT